MGKLFLNLLTMDALNYGKIKLLLASYFVSIFLVTSNLSAIGPCDAIKFTLEKYQPCCYRLHVDNSLIECYNQLRLTIDQGTYTSFKANTASGWTISQITASEILMNHNTGQIPFGNSIPGTFCLEPGFDPLLSITWDNTCDLLGCFFEIPINGCTIVADACITGVKYRECDQSAYSNQTLLPNFIINLFDDRGLFIASAVTDSTGEYSFCALAPGNYVVREVSQAGWTPNQPSSGQYAVTLLQSEIVTRNFGNCPVCSCDSIFVDLVEDGGEPDSCSYTLVIQNTGGYCFQNINFRSTSVKGSKSNTDDRILAPGWTINKIDSQNLVLIPPGGYIPNGISYPLKLYIGSGEVFIKATTYYSIGGNQQECSKDFSLICPRIKPTSCCPDGTIQGVNLVSNGNFEAPGTGPVGFTDCFPWFIPGSATSVGSYSVLQSNQVFAANTQWACTEHTTSAVTGKMLIVDGQNSTCNFVWQEMVTVIPGLQYEFCAFVNNLVIPTKNYDDPIIELWINNVQVQTITLAESPDQWQSLNALWSSGTSTTALLQIRLGSPNIVGNDFAVDDISFSSCVKDTCVCGPFDLQYSIGRGPLLPYDCGDTLYVPSSTAIVPIHFLSLFSCLGSDCPQATVDLILTGPPGFIPITISGVPANPDFIIPFTNATFSIAGLYSLTINGHCGTNVCPCTIYFKADGHDCCSNQFDFELGIANAVTITSDSIKCKAMLKIGNLAKCDTIGPIFWGDGTSSTGPFVAGAMPMHTYIGNGTYNISWTATEYDYSVMPHRKCFEKVFRDSIKLVCDTCKCKSFSSVFFYNPFWSGFNVITNCNDTSMVQLPCNNAGPTTIGVHGTLNCNAINCFSDSIHWQITELASGIPIASGIASHYFHIPNDKVEFELQLSSSLFHAGVIYSLQLFGQCGSDPCYCKINFSIVPCLCSCELLEEDVNQGYYVSGNHLSCNRTFKPIALCSDDKVAWEITPAISPVPGNSLGHNSQVIQFANSGIYKVCMNVTRINPNTMDTCRYEYCRKVTVNCLPNPSLSICDSNAVKNGDFSEGLVKGLLSKSKLAKSRGKIANWELFPNDGDGLVFVSDSTGASDDGSIILVGSKNNFAGIWQQVDLGVDSFVNIGFDYFDYRRSRLLNHLLAREIVFRLQNDSTLNSSSSLELFRKAMKDKRDEKERSYQRFDTTLKFQYNPEFKYLVICLQDQNDSVSSVIGLDNIELCTSEVPLNTYSEQYGKLGIYPNPSTGHFIIEMQQAAKSGSKFRIMDLNGRMIIEKQTVIGNQNQNIDASSLASGFYFLQFISEGKIIAVEKLMKQ